MVMKNKINVLTQLDSFRQSLEEYLQEEEELDHELSGKEFVEIADSEAIGDDARCTVCQKAINEMEGAYMVGDSFWVCSSSCEDKIEVRPTVKFSYR